MEIINPAESDIGNQFKKKLGRSSEYGQRIYGSHEYGELDSRYGIYQIRKGEKYQIIVKSKFYIPTNPQTPTQQANRQKLTDGVIAWQNLTNEQQASYNVRAKYKPYSGYNLFLSEYLLSN